MPYVAKRPRYASRKPTRFGGSYKKRGKYFRKSSYGAVMRTKSTSGATQKAQIAGLAKRVNALAQVQARRTDTVLYGLSDVKSLAQVVSGYTQIPLMNFYGSSTPKWEPIFGTSASPSKSTLKLNSIKLNYWLHNNDENQLTHHTIAIMAPKSKQVLQDFLTNQLVNGTDFYQGAYPSNDTLKGQVLINMQRWKVYHFRRVITHGATTHDGVTEATTSVRTVQGKKTLNLGWTLKNSDNVANTTWENLDVNDLPYYMRLFFFTFTDGTSIADGDAPQLRLEGLVSGSTYD